MQQAAQALGLSFAYLPVPTTGATPDQAQQLRHLLGEACPNLFWRTAARAIVLQNL